MRHVYAIHILVISLSISVASYAKDTNHPVWVNEEVRKIADQYGLTVIAEAPADFDLAAFKAAAEQIASMRDAAVADPNLLPDEPEQASFQGVEGAAMAANAFLFVRCSKTHHIPAGHKTIKLRATARYTTAPRQFTSIDTPVYWVEGTTVGGFISYSHVQPRSWISNGGKKANVSATFTVTVSAGGVADTSFGDCCRVSKKF